MKTSQKSLILVLGSLLLTLPALRADDPAPGGPPEGRREMRREKMGERGDRMGDELGLSEDQKTQMKAINEAERAEMEALRDGGGVTDEKRAKIDAIRKSYMEKRQAVMTPEQREKAKQMREKRGKRMGEGRPDRPHGQHPEPK